MLSKIKLVIQILWTSSMLILCTAIGASYGFSQHGISGAIALGFVGLCIGALAAAAPDVALEILVSGIW
ncbi:MULTISPECIES: hypothetical protein [unclassified Bradyrhizobium]|uniref:hypothetical protein n=1 Tax=unclassified Bradyrhizobium TaxID=2631580 RepID=UPI0028E984C7|nr:MULTISPECIES: hypothetical protein [unclassified Bradyrhizobium]